MTELDKTRDLWASVEDIIAQLHHQMSQMSEDCQTSYLGY